MNYSSLNALGSEIAKINKVVLDGVFSDGTKVTLILANAKVTSEDKEERYGADGGPVDTKLETMEISINGVPITFTKSNYAELGNVNIQCGASIERTSKDTFRIKLKGGDGAGTYTALFDFSFTQFIKKSILDKSRETN
jgi:hypothetical protein